MVILDKINKILNNNYFKECLNKNIVCEKDREFCHHDLEHFLAVGRICYIMVLEKKLDIDKEIVYAAALLHDIGKWKQYSEGRAHEIASAEISCHILKECGYNEKNIDIIINAILHHRVDKVDNMDFNSILYKSDKISRNCFCCTTQKLCKWSSLKKNSSISY